MRDCPEKFFRREEYPSENRSKGHYRREAEKPFLQKELLSTTLLFGGLTWKHEILLKASFENLGYKCDTVPNPDFEALQLGKEFCDPGLCNPVYFTCGALLKYLRNLEAKGLTKNEIIKGYVFFTAGSCGPCRFGMYESQFRLGLKNAGFSGFRVLVFQQNEGLDQSKEESALKFNHDFFIRLLSAFVIADLINDMVYQYRPYEIEKGSVDKLLEETMSNAYGYIKNLRYPYLVSLVSILAGKNKFLQYISLLVKIIFFAFCKENNIILSEFFTRLKKLKFNFLRVKPIVKITGEFWAQTTEGDGNLNMHRYLEENGAQVIPEPLSNWIMYMLHQLRFNKSLEIKRNFYKFKLDTLTIKKLLSNYADIALFRFAESTFKLFYNKFRRKLGHIPYKLISQDRIRRNSENYFNPLIEGGEGHLEIGKTIYYTDKRLSHMVISLKPFGCMPSTMSDGIMSAVSAHRQNILLSSIETGGEGIVNMYSRAIMTLNEAKESARIEFLETKKEFKSDEFLESNKLENTFYGFPKTLKYNGKISVASRFLYLIKRDKKCF